MSILVMTLHKRVWAIVLCVVATAILFGGFLISAPNYISWGMVLPLASVLLFIWARLLWNKCALKWARLVWNVGLLGMIILALVFPDYINVLALLYFAAFFNMAVMKSEDLRRMGVKFREYQVDES